MKKRAFNKLVKQYLQDQLKATEKQKLDDWMAYLAQNETYKGLSEAEQAEAEIRIYKKVTERIKITKQPTGFPAVFQLQPLLKVAACFALVGLLVFSFRVRLKEVFNIQQYASVQNYKGHITKAILSDGSIIWLKGNSKLNYPISFEGDLRKVNLVGEALFEVAKDAHHPFIIHCGTLTTRVLGTSFNIKNSSNKTEVNVLTGRVFLSSKSIGAITLHPHQKAVYSELKKTLIKEAQPNVEVAALTKGTEYNMFFNDARVADVLQRIEKKFEIAITVENPKLKSSMITADFTDQSLKNTLNMMSEALNVAFEIDGQTVLLKNKV